MGMSLSVAVERDLSKGQLVFLLVHRETAPQRATGLLSQDRQPPWQISALAQPHQEPKSLLTIPTGQLASLDLILMPHVPGISVPMGSQVCLLQPSLNPPRRPGVCIGFCAGPCALPKLSEPSPKRERADLPSVLSKLAVVLSPGLPAP